MSDKVLVKRELLEGLAHIAEIEGQPEGAQARALLTAQPQASAAQCAPDEREAFEAYSQSIGYTLKVGDSGRYIGGYGAELWSGFKAGAAWQRTQSAPVVPEGWRLVPEELTLEMQAAAKGISRWQYEDMLAAASKVAPHG